MEGQNLNSKNSEEIDVAQIFRWIGKGFKNFGNGILFVLAALRYTFHTNRIYFTIVIFLGLAIGFGYHQLLRKKSYQSTMVLGCEYLNSRILKNTIDKLNVLCSEPERKGLAQELQIDEKSAKQIAGFGFTSFVSEDEVVEIEVLREKLNNLASEKKDLVEKVINTLQIENEDAYQISALVYDPVVIKVLETALVRYFANAPYIKRRIEINKTLLESRKKKLQSESVKLDSLKQIIYANYNALTRQTKGTNNVILGEEKVTDPMKVFAEDLRINAELITIERDLYLQTDFEVIDNFMTVKQPVSSSLQTILAVSLLGSVVVGYLVIGAVKFDKMLAAISEKSR